MIYRALRSLLFALEAEHAHEVVTTQMQHLQRVPIVMRAIERMCRPSSAPRELLGMRFRSPIGIAAGRFSRLTSGPVRRIPSGRGDRAGFSSRSKRV